MNELSDAELLERFRNGSITREHWNHRSHVRVAFLKLREQPYDTALDKVRRGIMALNEALGTGSTPSGYNETVTCAWMRLVADAMKRDGSPAEDSLAFLEAHPELGHKQTLLEYYSEPTLESVRAQRSFIEPDREPLPGTT